MDPQLKANILAAFGLTGLPPEQQDEMVTKIGGTVFQGVLVRAIEGMSPDEQERFEKELDRAGETPEAILLALKTSVPNFSELVQAEVSRLADESRQILG